MVTFTRHKEIAGPRMAWGLIKTVYQSPSTGPVTKDFGYRNQVFNEICSPYGFLKIRRFFR